MGEGAQWEGRKRSGRGCAYPVGKFAWRGLALFCVREWCRLRRAGVSHRRQCESAECRVFLRVHVVVRWALSVARFMRLV